jgi:hypothetical protein
MKLLIHKLGTNTYGEDAMSCVLKKLAAPAADDFDGQYSDREQAAINVLEELLSPGDNVSQPGASRQRSG